MPLFYENENTPLGALTVGDLKRLIEEILSTNTSSVLSEKKGSSPTELVYGIRGIERLFNVSHRTAQTYKNTFLKPAVSQNGRKIVIDRDLALKLFAEHEEKGGAR